MKFKKLLTAFLAAALASSSIACQALAANFADINDVPWDGAKQYINAVADAGLMVGDYNSSGAKVFRSRDKVSYCETMQLVYSLMKQYTGKAVEASVVTKYTTVMSGYKIPVWAYEAVAYGLENGIVTISDIPGFVSSSGANVNATRQDVAIMLGRALKSFETVNNSAALTFKDASSVASVAVPYVDLLNRLGIITGDDSGNFNPKNYINRAEMAVVVSKTNDLIKSKGQSGNNGNNNNNNNTNNTTQNSSATGTVTAVELVGSNIALSVNLGSSIATYTGSASMTCLKGTGVITLAQVVVGDKVLVSYNGTNIKSVAVTEPAKTDTNSSTNKESIKGTFNDISKSEITIKVNGEKKTYNFDNINYVKFHYNDDSKEYSEFKNKIESGDSIVLYFDKDNYVIRADAEDGGDEDDKYDVTGYYDKIKTSYISLKKSKSSSSSKDYDFKGEDKKNVTFYIGSKEKDYDDFKDELEDNDKIGLVTNSKDEVTEAHIIDDDDDKYDEEGYFNKVSKSYIYLRDKRSGSGYDDKYEFKYTDSDIDDVSFYIDDKKKDYDAFEDKASDGDKVGLVKSGSKITKVYLSTDDDDDDDDDYDKTGYLYKLSDEYIRITSKKSSSDYDEYEFKNSDSDDVKFYIKDKKKDYEDFDDDVSKGDKVGIKLNSSKKVTEVHRLSSSSSTDEKEGEIYKITKSSLKLSGSSVTYEVDDIDDIDVKVTDGEDKIKDYKDLITAVSDDSKTAEVTVEYDDDMYIKSIEGHISKATGILSSISTANKTIDVEFDSKEETRYKYKSSMDVDLHFYKSSVDGLVEAYN